MKRIFAAFVLLLLMRGAGWAEDGYVRLAIQGTNVNLRPQPRIAGNVVARANAGDVFIAEKWPIVCADERSEWYRIVLAGDAKSDKIFTLAEWNPRFKEADQNVAFVSVGFAASSPLAEGDLEKIAATRWGARSLHTDPSTGRFSPEADAGFRFFSAKRSIRKNTDIYDRDFTARDGAKVIGRYETGDAVLLLATNSGETVYAAEDQNFERPFGWIAGEAVDKVGMDHEPIEVSYFAGFSELFAGFDIGEMVRKWGDFEIKRSVEQWIDGEYFIFASLEAQDMRIGFYESEPYCGRIVVSSFDTDRKGVLVGGITIGADWCDQDWVRKTFGRPHDAGDETWSWHSEFQSLSVSFGRDGLVSSVSLRQRAAD